MRNWNFSRLQTRIPSSSQSSPYPILSVKGRKEQKGFPLNSSPDKGEARRGFGLHPRWAYYRHHDFGNLGNSGIYEFSRVYGAIKRF